MGKSSTKGNGKNKAIKHRLDRPVQVKKAAEPTTVESGKQLTNPAFNTKSNAQPKVKGEMSRLYTSPKTRSRTEDAIEAAIGQERKISRVPGAVLIHLTGESYGDETDPWW